MKVPGGKGEETVKDDGDFSEYLWMENEEEFDREVMRQLEEEALMEQCIQAMLDDEKDASQAFQEVTSCLDDLSIRDNTQIVLQSKLNPDAAEFVPRTSSKPSSVA